MPELERALRELGRELDWPVEPSLAGAVAARLRAQPAPRRFPLRPLAIAFAAVVAAFAVALAVPPARSAILDFFGIGAVTVERVETLPDLPAARVAPGMPVTLEEAREGVPFELFVPPDYDAVYLDRVANMVTFVWPDRLLSELPGDEFVLKKVLGSETRTEFVQVDDADGVWIEGAPHGLFLPGGEARLAGNVLIWVRDGVTFRLEGDLSLERALEIAGTLSPSGT